MANLSGSMSHGDAKTKKLKDALNHAILSHVNISVLAAMQETFETNQGIKSLLGKIYQEEKIPEKLINQSQFLGHAYMCLVWLPEVVEKNLGDQDKGRIIQKIGAEIGYNATREQISGYRVEHDNKLPDTRRITDFKGILRIIRNGLSHARVEIDSSKFKISDRDQKNEPYDTTISLTWRQLGRIADAYLFAVRDLLYPRGSQP